MHFKRQMGKRTVENPHHGLQLRKRVAIVIHNHLSRSLESYILSKNKINPIMLYTI